MYKRQAYPNTKGGSLVECPVTGTSYAPQGEVSGLKVALPDLSKVCALCNQASIHYEKGKYERVGEPK